MATQQPAVKKDLILGVKLCHPAAKMPEYMTPGSACFDIRAVGHQVNIYPGKHAMIKTGLKFAIPPQWVLMTYSRSGHAVKNRISLSNSVGIIDSDYTGELFVSLRNDSTEMFPVYEGDRIAQGLLMPARMVTLAEVDEIKETLRGEGGAGSTGT